MRKGAQKKKEKQLEELHLDRREALGELVLGMYVQGSWDDDLLARGAAEVAEVERELQLLTAPGGPAREEPPSGEMAAEHDFPPTGEYTAEHDLPPTGEYTAEHDLPETGEHVLRPPGEHTEEHLLPSWRTAGEPSTPETAPAAGTGSATEAEKAAPEPEAAKPEAAKAGPERESPKPKPKPEPEAVKPKPESPAEPKPPTVAPTPSATAPVTPPVAKSPKTAAPAARPGPEPAVASAAATGADSKPDGGTTEPAATESPLARLEEKIEADHRRARNAIDAAKATLKTESRTETAVITRDIAEGSEKLDSTLKEAAALITRADERAAAAEAKLAREGAAGREAAAAWVRGQAAEIEADAALAVEIGQEESTTAAPATGEADPVLTARVAALEAELAAEKAAKTEALVKAEARLGEIESRAKAAEERVAAAAEAATAAKPVPEPAPDPSGRSEAEAREAAVAWLRGQIGALRKELAGQDDPPAKPAGDETGRGDS